jgi:hypothetical protein
MIADAVLWAIAYYYGDRDVEPIASPARYRRRRSSERVVPVPIDVDGRAQVIEAPNRSETAREETRRSPS